MHGEPECYQPLVSIEHNDGSPLTHEELEKLIKERINQSLPDGVSVPENIFEPGEGAVHAFIAQVLESEQNRNTPPTSR